MTIILFLIDTSASMNQRTYLGARPTLLDVAKDAVEKFLKARARDVASRGDRYMLLTFEDPPHNIKAGWKENHAVFMNELKHLTATGITNLGPALKHAFDLLNLNRMQSGIDMYGLGRCPYYLEPSIIIVITDGSTLSHSTGVQGNLELPMQNQSVPGSELTREPFRWDQRLFSLVLRLPGTPPADLHQNSCVYPDTNSPIGAMCSVTAGRAYSITSLRSLMQSIESLVQKVQSGVVIQFEKIGPDPPLIADAEQATDQVHNWQNTRSLIYVPRSSAQKGFAIGHWPIPEAFWSDSNLPALPQRSAHPLVKFTCAGVEPHVMDTLPFDKYELEVSPLTQYIISRKQPHIAWQVYISNSNKSNELGPPFGYLKASTNLSCVNLFVMPYNYPVLLPIIDEILKKPQHPNKPPREWRIPFEEYLRSMPPYYAAPLKRALTRMGAIGNLVPDNLEATCYSYSVHGKLKQYKNEAKMQFEKLVASIAQPKQQNHETVRVLQCGNSLKAQVESTSYVNMKCTGRPSCAFYYRYSTMRSELNEFPNYMIRVRDKISTIPCNDNLKVKHTFRNPYDIDRRDLIDQIKLMRANFMQNPSRIKFKDEDQIHTLPVAQMGNYQDYLKKRPTPLREIESAPVRQHMFGNPFKIDKKGMIVDEADIDLGSSSKKNTKLSKDQRRRGPLPKDFYIFGPNSWQRSPTSSPSHRSTSPIRQQQSESYVSDEDVNTDDSYVCTFSEDGEDRFSDDSNYRSSKIKFTVTNEDLELRSNIFKQIRRPGTNFKPVLKTISQFRGSKRKFLIEEAKREANRFKRRNLIAELNLLYDPWD